MSMTTTTADYFASVAGQWDVMRARYFHESVRDAAIARAYLWPARPDAGAARTLVVADVGTGTGFMAAGLAPLAEKVYALDGSPAMLDVARGNLSAFANVECRLADGSALSLADASVDAVFANMYLHHCADPAAAIREMVRILRPGGRLVVTDMEQHDHEWMRREMADEWLGFERGQIKAWLRDAGLVNVLVDCASQSCCAVSEVDAGQSVRVNVFVAAGSRRVAGAKEAVQANYGAVAEGQGCGCSANASVGDACCSPAATVALRAVPADVDACCSSGDATARVDTMAGDACCSQVATIALTDVTPTATGACCVSANAMPQIEALAGDAGPLAPAPSSAANAGMAWVTGYSPEQLATIPADAVNLSLGCGNPTAMAALQPGQVVLDIGSGAGIDAFYAARRVGPTGHVFGLDMTPAMIERARRSAEAAGLSQVEFRLGNAEQMPIADGTVDVVLSNCVINLCEDKGRVFEEAYRVLKVGGRLSISDMVADRPFPVSWRSDPARWAGCVHGALPEQEYLDLVREAGFTDVRATRSLSGGQAAGVQVYSLAVTAGK